MSLCAYVKQLFNTAIRLFFIEQLTLFSETKTSESIDPIKAMKFVIANGVTAMVSTQNLPKGVLRKDFHFIVEFIQDKVVM